MQFSTVTLFAAAAAAVSATTVTKTEESSTLVTITSCGPSVTNCPGKVTSQSQWTNATSSAPHTLAPANVTSWENAAGKNYAVGFAALAAGALLAL